MVAGLGVGKAGGELRVIAHRFGYALVYGAAALNAVPVLGRRCDNPLCQSIGPVTVCASVVVAVSPRRGRNRRSTR